MPAAFRELMFHNPLYETAFWDRGQAASCMQAILSCFAAILTLSIMAFP
jgi:hypothetical protein